MSTSGDRTRTPSVDLPWQDDVAPFGAGTIDEATIATSLDGIDDAPDHERNDVTTYLFRSEFDSPDPTTILGLRASLLSDDGGILYINGQEVFRTLNMRGLDPMETTTLVHDAGSESYVNYALDAVDALIEGVNSIAFELHQAELDSSDVAFDLGLTAMVVTEPSTVVGRHVFYNDSAFDGDDPAIATDKSALLAGVPATFENYTNFDGGINGIIVDIDRLGRSGVITGTDFEFRVGNSDDLSTWTSAPDISGELVRLGEGEGGSDRVMIVWPDGATTNQWLEVTVLANDATGLEEDDVFYFGNAIGDTGDSPFFAIVDDADLDAIGANHVDPAGIENIYDINRDGRVDPTDAVIVRTNYTAGGEPMTMLWAPVPEPSTFALAAFGLLSPIMFRRRK